MNLYSIDVRVYATAYIRAGSEEAALAIAKGLKDSALELNEQWGGDMVITGLTFDNPDLPDVSLSPSMTIIGPADDAQAILAD